MHIKNLFTTVCIFLFAVSSLLAQNTYVPDNNFEQALIDLGFDTGELNDSVPTIHVETVTSLNINGKNISDLTGIEDFVSLAQLNCGNNNLNYLDLSSNSLLEEFSCFNNNLSSIDLASNTFLTDLLCYNNNLTALDLSSNTAILNINCSNNQITQLDLSSNTSLIYVNCSSNELNQLNLKNGNNSNMTGGNYWETGIDTRNNPNLYCIQVDDAANANSYYTWYEDAWSEYTEDCSGYEVRMAYVPDDNFEQALIDLGYDSGMPDDYVPTTSIKKVTYLNLQYKKISDLTGIEEFVTLGNLNCYSNQISEINLNTLLNLRQLQCQNNKISELDLGANVLLTQLYCHNNNLSDLDISSNTLLTNLNAINNQLTGLNLRNGNNSNMNIDVRNNPDLLCIQVDDEDAANSYSGWQKNSYTVYSENCSDYVMEMTYVPDDNFEQALINAGFDFESNLNDSVPTVAIKNLTSLNINYKNITDLTGIEDFIALENLYCYNNQISEINLSTLINLKILQCQYNQIFELDLGANVLLTQLNCSGNNLSDLDLSSNTLLTNLNASNNQLTGLNLRNGNNSNMSIDVRYSSDLLCIQVDNPVASYGYANWNKNTYTAYSENCSDYVMEMTYVPDDNFEQALINLGLDFDENLNDSVPTLALQTLTGLYVNNKSIHNFTGIQDCINLKYFYCHYNYIDSLDLSNNPELIELDCSNNNLEVLDISANKKLTKLSCANNSLTRIVFSKHDLLEFINCSNNRIEEISDIESSSLASFYCDNNKLTKLIVNKLPALTTLVCRDNNLQEIDISSNSQLNWLYAERNLLTFINLQNANNQNLYLYAYDNMPACIQVDDTITAQNKPENEWTIDDWSYYSENCTGHHVDMVYIPDDNFEQALLEQRYDDGILNDSVPKSIAENIRRLNIDDSNISDLTGIENFINLEGISCNNNNLTKLDLSKNIDLQGIRCANNKIDTLNINTCYGLTDLICYKNLISEIDVSSFPLLYRFWCNENTIVNLDLSNNPNLDYFVANDNSLSSLNLKNRDNMDLQLDVRNNPNLFCIEVDDAYAATQYTNWYKDEIAAYSEDCSNKSVMTYIPDDNFEQALINLGYDSGELNDSVPTVNIYSVLYLSIQNRKIESLEGIQDFELLSDLNCSFNQIQVLDLSNNKKLNSLRANNPNLTCIEVDDPEASLSYFNWYKDSWASYSENCGNSGAGVPLSEYNSLVDLYNSTLGEEWTNNTNWLDTTNHTVDDWYGITVEDGHVTQILLSGNNLQNNAFEELIQLPYLRWISLEDNALTGFDFSKTDSLKQLDTLIIFNNHLIFEDIEPAFSTLAYSNYENKFYYSPQAKIDVQEDVEVVVNHNYSVEISEDYISPNDQFQWYKDGNKLEGETGSTIEFLPVTKSDSGSYWLQITNPGVPDLTLISHYKTLYVNSPKGAGVPISEYNALVDFYNNLDGDNWTRNDNWLDTINHSVGEWYGITVKNGHVTEIYFGPYYNYNLNGSIPNNIKDLTQLESLIIVTDNVSGELPEGLFELTNLKKLNLGECNISGSLPAEIENLTKLEILGLEANKLEGTIPTEIGNLTNLKFLSFYENKLTGGIPPSLGQLTNLEYLALAYNQLTGTIPPTIGNLTNLKWLLLENNELTGPLPVELAQLTNALKISLDNNLIGEMQDSLKSENIKSAQADNNRQIPDELADLMQMDTLYLGGNKLQFNDIEAIFSWENYSEFEDFIYAPQDSVGLSKTIERKKGGEITLQIDHYFPGPSDQYQWFKNGEVIEGANSSSLFYGNLEEADSGIFICKITNPVANELTLYSKAIKLIVSDAVGTEDVAQVEVNLYPNPAAGQLYLDVQNRHVNLEIFNATGSLVRTLPDITNGWIEVSELRKGIYLFKIKLKDSQTLFKKVIIRN
jgi:Leucine-rich repeat (LRR) protein